jgi:TonB family protein
MFDQFQSPKGRSTQSLVISLAIHVALTIAILAAGFTVKSLVAPTRATTVQWIAPAPVRRIKRPAIRPPKIPLPTLAKLPPPRLTVPLAPEPAPTVLKPLPLPVPATVAVAKEASPPPVQPPAPKEVFAASMPAAKGTTNTPAKVQLGGFSTATTGFDRQAPKLQLAAAGFGDAATAPASTARRSVSTSGFGDASVTSASANPRGQVRSSGFGDAVIAAPSAATARAPAPPPATAAQILAKPRPAYTEEARRLEIEGEVQLEVVFGASGDVLILRVVRGLGHGLDENAVIAAKAIRFLPARRDGHTVDSTALVHIIFQLAS